MGLRLSAPEYAYTDPTSGVNTRELLALSWLAIHDGTMRIGELKNAMHQVIEGLYEIQRGYNLSETGADSQGADVSICSSGTFNKLLEKLQGVHLDVDIEVITPKLAALKLPVVVKEEVNDYLAAKENPPTFSEFTQFTDQIKQIKEKGVEVIWNSIKGKVATRMFAEFGSLYANQNDPHFAAFIDAGKDVNLEELPFFQKKVSESEGYRQYCSLTLRSPRMFSQHQPQGSGADPSNGWNVAPKSP